MTRSSPFPVLGLSPWPFLGGAASLVLGIGLVLFMHDWGPEVLILGVGALLWVIGGWWRDMLREAKGPYPAVVAQGLRIGFGLFIASEVMFFVGFFWGFLDASLTSPKWPPPTIHPIDPFDWPYLNTLILLLSGTTLTSAYQGMLEGCRKEFLQGLGLTIGLGILFTMVQAYEYGHATFGFRDGIYPSVFYMATGFHGLHVLIGVAFLSFCWIRAWRHGINPKQHVGFEAACWYWQFVDVVWLLLFVVVYWWGGQ